MIRPVDIFQNGRLAGSTPKASYTFSSSLNPPRFPTKFFQRSKRLPKKRSNFVLLWSGSHDNSIVGHRPTR